MKSKGPFLFWLVLPALASAAAVSLYAQAVREQPPLYRSPETIVWGVFVTPIAGAPFTATVTITSERPAAEGSVETQHSMANIARDSNGRIRNERHAMVPEVFRGMPPLIAVHIFDPATRISNFYNPYTLISRQQIVPSPQEDIPAGAEAEDLGSRTLNGMETRGRRRTRTVPGPVSGTGKPVEVTDEYWYSEDLHMNLLERHVDPRSGTQTVSITKISREEPSPELFEVPAGYKIVDLTPPANAPVAAR